MHLDEYMDATMPGTELRHEARRVGLEIEAWRSATQVILSTATGSKIDIFAEDAPLVIRTNHRHDSQRPTETRQASDQAPTTRTATTPRANRRIDE